MQRISMATFLSILMLALIGAACGDSGNGGGGNDPVPPPPPPLNMALIPSGCFNMGDAFSEGTIDELPVHNVCITSSFYMDVHEVTNAEYAACVSGGGCIAPVNSSSFTRASYYGNPTYNNFPRLYVSWNQATAYCTWAGKRLPTEAEWEYAARGGLSGKRFPWGDSISGANANYSGSGDPWDEDTSQVAYFPANGYGLYDMSGNVCEWVNDWYLSTYYSTRPNPDNDPPGPASGTYRGVRGGGFSHPTAELTVADRNNGQPTSVDPRIGFRCAGD
jgi:formylglycine-generating enzyme required for sulfatase activity